MHDREPVKHTCPDIDKIIMAIKSIQKLSNPRYMYEEIEQFKDVLSDIESECGGLESTLEELRKSNYKLREWGEEEAERVDEFENELKNSNNEK